MPCEPNLSRAISNAQERQSRIKELQSKMKALDEQLREENRGFTSEEKRGWEVLWVELKILGDEKEADPLTKPLPSPSGYIPIEKAKG